MSMTPAGLGVGTCSRCGLGILIPFGTWRSGAPPASFCPSCGELRAEEAVRSQPPELDIEAPSPAEQDADRLFEALLEGVRAWRPPSDDAGEPPAQRGTEQ